MHLVPDLALILIIAGVVSILFKRLKQPLVLGYIVAGFICSPRFEFFPSILDEVDVSVWADIGVIFLMFTLGLEFSFKKIFKMGSMPFIAACTIIFCMIGLGAVAGHCFGWSRINSLFLGGMLAMSSTTVIYKALTDMGLRQQRFASGVMSVLVVEDILGILLMVVLSTLAVSSSFQGAQLVNSLFELSLVLVMWFVVGVFLIPSFLRKARRWMSAETLLIVSLGLCFLMVVLAERMHYSSAFGAFMMGSILAETIEAEQITRLVEPVKDLFGAIFFVSVGMLVNPDILLQYWWPILILVVLILVGQAVFGSLGFLLAGNPLRVAMQSGFCMAQIGEFAFIIAALGERLNVTASFLYPVVVSVSVITTFLTPYMIRLAPPTYQFVVGHLPKFLLPIVQESEVAASTETNRDWTMLLKMLLRQVVIYGFVCVAVIIICLHTLRPYCLHFVDGWPGNLICFLITFLALSPFVRAIVMRKNHSEVFLKLWHERSLNRFPLIFTIVVRYVISSAFIVYVLNSLFPISIFISWLLGIVMILPLLASSVIKQGSIRIEHLFLRNFHMRELLATEKGQKKPQYADRLKALDVHMTTISIPMNTQLAGKSLLDLNLTNSYGVMVVAIFRMGTTINIPGPQERIFPGDSIQLIGNDAQLTAFAKRICEQINPDILPDPSREMQLRSITITDRSVFCDKRVNQCGIKESYQCMLAGFQNSDSSQLLLPHPERVIRSGDILWIVGERKNIARLVENES